MQYSPLFNSVDEGFCVVEVIFGKRRKPVDCRLLETNKVFEKQTGLKNATGKLIKGLAPQLGQHWFDSLGEVVKTGRTTSFSLEANELPGQDRDFDVFTTRIGDKNSNHVAVFFSDPPVKKPDKKDSEQLLNQEQVAEKLRESEARYRRLIELAPEAVAIHEGGKLIFANQLAAKVLGAATPEELIGLPIMQFVHPDYVEPIKARVVQAIQEGKPTEVAVEKFIRLDGKVIDVEVITAPFPYQGKVAVQVMARDITERKRAQDRERESEARWHFLVQSLPQKIFIATPKGKIEYYNEQWCQYTGMTLADMLKKHRRNFIHADDLDKSRRQWAQAIKNKKPMHLEHRLKQHDGQYRWHTSLARPMRDENGKITMWIGSSSDTEDLHRNIELEQQTELLTQRQEQLLALNQAKDEFISLASHQLRTPATSVKQYIGMLLDGYFGEVPEQHLMPLNTAYDSNERQIKIVDDILGVARLEADNVQLHKQPIKLAALAKSVANAERPVVKEAGQSINVIGADCKVQVQGDESKLRDVVENLVDNASKYSKPGTKITLKVYQSGTKACLDVIDEGIGIKKADQGKIFDKFSRLANANAISADGTGLGLYWVKRIIDLHEGTVDVKSTPGAGSTFSITLPATKP